MAVAVTAAAVLATAGCGSSGSTAPAATGPSSAPASTPSASPSASYHQLDQAAVEAALVPLSTLPVGYAKDPDQSSPSTKTFCDYTEPAQPTAKVSRDYIKGGGLSSELISISIREYARVATAKASYDALAHALETCTKETVDGQAVTYSLSNVAPVADGSLAVRIDFGQGTVLSQYTLVGNALVTVGGGGLLDRADSELGDLSAAQAAAWSAAATG